MVTLRKGPIRITTTTMIKLTTISIKTISNLHMVEMATMTNRKQSCREFTRFVLTRCSGYYNADSNNPYHQDGGYYDGHQQGYQDEYYNDQYYDQGTPAAGQQPHYGQGGYA